MAPLGDIIRDHSIDFHSYADDTQLYISMEPNDPDALSSLITCLSAVEHWMSNNFLKLNEDKTEVLLIGPKTKRDAVFNSLGKNMPSNNQWNLTTLIKSEATSLGVVLDSDLSFKSHINKVTKASFFHLRNIAKVRPFLSQKDAEKIIHAFVSSRLDYCNALYSGCPKNNINKLQLVQNAAARILTKTRRTEHITPVLFFLHWLPIEARIDLKILFLTFKALHGLAPGYLADLLRPYILARGLRSQDARLLVIPPVARKTVGGRAFQTRAPILWNSLPKCIREADSINVFKTRLKTYLFTKFYG